MKKQMDDLHAKILRKFHTLCSLAGLTAEDKMAVVASYDVESSADIDTHDLIDICNTLAKQVDPNYAYMDTLRKRLIACIGGYLKKLGSKNDIATIKAVACRASGHSSFSKIPKQRLISLYNAFRKYSKDMDSVNELSRKILAGELYDTTQN
jgi:hypothetical protein